MKNKENDKINKKIENEEKKEEIAIQKNNENISKEDGKDRDK